MKAKTYTMTHLEVFRINDINDVVTPDALRDVLGDPMRFVATLRRQDALRIARRFVHPVSDVVWVPR